MMLVASAPISRNAGRSIIGGNAVVVLGAVALLGLAALSCPLAAAWSVVPTTTRPAEKGHGHRPTTATTKTQLQQQASAAFFTVATAATATAFVVMSSPLPAYAADADIAHGAELFKAECAGCHMGGNNFMSEKKTLKKDALQQYQSLDAAKLADFVSNQMPHSFLPFHSKWSSTDFGDVVSYVLDQAVNDKWE